MAEQVEAGKPLPEWAWLLLLLVLCLFAVGPLMLPGYHWEAQDARHSIYFLLEFDRAISDGIIYPRWAPDFTFGYGYPFFNIYGPFSCYLGEALHLLGCDLVTAVKLVFAIGAIASALSAYLWLRLYARPPGALLGALLYLYAPYHIVDLYVRASLAEVVALAFLPLCLWAFDRLLRRPSVGGLVLSGFSYAGLMLSSQLLTMLFSPVLGGFLLVQVYKRMKALRKSKFSLPKLLALARLLLPPALAILLGLGLSAIFWLPAFAEYKYVRTDQWVGGYYEYRNHFISLFQLFRLHWDFGVSLPGPDDGLSFQLGLVPVALTCLGLLSWRQLPPAWRHITMYFLVTTGIVIFLVLPVSQPVWQAIGLVRFAQFPWRLLALTVLTLSFLAVTSFANWRNDTMAAAMTLLWSLLIILPVYPYLQAQVRPSVPNEVSLQGLMRFQQSADEMTGSTIWVKEIPRWSPLADQIMAGIPITTKVDYVSAYGSGHLVPHSMAFGTTYERVWFQADDDQQRLRFHTFYYPGWQAYILDEKTEQVQGTATIIPEGELGLITVPVPQGRHILLLVFEDTPVRKAGTALTVMSVVACLALGLGALVLRLHRR